MKNRNNVTCNKCLKVIFNGNRFKCLSCLDYDICSSCHENGISTDSHTAEHPVQCINMRSSLVVLCGGAEMENPDLPLLYTCPCCGQVGYTEDALIEHVMLEHKVPTPYIVVCPLCATTPTSQPDFLTKDFATHLFSMHCILHESVHISDSDTSTEIAMAIISSNAQGRNVGNAHGSGYIRANADGDVCDNGNDWVADNADAGFSGNIDDDISDNMDAGFSGNMDAGFSGNIGAGFSGNKDAVVTGNIDAGFGGNIDAAFGGNIDAGFGGNIDAAFGGNIDAGFGGNIDDGVTGNIDAGVAGQMDAGFSGNIDAGVAGKIDGGISGNVDGGVTGKIDGGISGNVDGGVTGKIGAGFSGNLGGGTTGNVDAGVEGGSDNATANTSGQADVSGVDDDSSSY